jgi:hypothetical protein
MGQLHSTCTDLPLKYREEGPGCGGGDGGGGDGGGGAGTGA